jgi:hypothetical protein
VSQGLLEGRTRQPKSDACGVFSQMDAFRGRIGRPQQQSQAPAKVGCAQQQGPRAGQFWTRLDEHYRRPWRQGIQKLSRASRIESLCTIECQHDLSIHSRPVK